MAGTRATASQAWAILKRHARDEIEPLRLQELCKDNERVSSLVSVHNADASRMMVVDLSRQRMTLETLNHLLRLASARGIRSSIKRLAWGENDPGNPVVPNRIRKSSRRHSSNDTEKPTSQMSYYLSLRVPEGSRMLNSEGGNALRKIHYEWDRIKQVTESIRRGQYHGITGSMIKDVIVVGRGVPVMALRFIYLALCKDRTATIARKAGLNDINNRLRLGGGGIRRLKFLTSVDPVRAIGVIGDLDPSSTIVISIAMNGNEETKMATNTLKIWLLQALETNQRSAEAIIGRHMMMVTGNRKINTELKRDNIFVLPDAARCEPFSTFTAATLLPLAIIFGWHLTRQFVDGAHTMDKHFVETNPRHNLPVLLALTDIWNDSLLSSNGRIVSPFAEALAAYPAFCANLEAQTCGSGPNAKAGSSLVIDGGLHHSYDKALYSATKVFPSEMIMTLDSQTSFNVSSKYASGGRSEDVYTAQDLLICSVFAHADELAFGSVETGTMSLLEPNPEPVEIASSDGNRPSTVLICDRCDAFACGQLVALAEHRAVIKAWICDVDPFSKVAGSSIRVSRTDSLKERLDQMFAKLSNGEDLDDDEDEPEDGRFFNLSTRTILRHYANMMKDERAHAVK